MGTLVPEAESHLESIIYFLSESLAAATRAGDALQHSVCRSPHIEPGMNCAEIAGQLADFRKTMQELWECELLMVTKLLRANDLARELRDYATELKPEIDTFRLTAIMAGELCNGLLPKAEAIFNGSIEPKRFLESRGFDLQNSAIRHEPLRGYKVAGQTDVRLLLDACEALHYSLAARYGFQMPVLEEHRNAQMLEMPAENGEDDDMLLLNLDEIVSDPLSSQLTEWINRQHYQELTN